MAFSFVGMKPLEVRYNGQIELKIKLEEEVAEMDEVVVTGIFKKSQESFTGSVSTITEKELKSFRGRNLIIYVEKYRSDLQYYRKQCLWGRSEPFTGSTDPGNFQFTDGRGPEK